MTDIKKLDRHEEKILSLNQTNALRGICALWIMLGHLGMNTNLKALWIFWKGNLLIVGVFFLISGYGVMYNLLNKGKGYFDGFLQRRILGLMIPAYIVYLISCIIDVFVNDIKIDLVCIIKFVFFNKFLDKTNWFVWEIVAFYCIFFILFKFLKRDVAFWIFLVITVLFEVWASFYLKDNQAWYTSTMALPFGLFYAMNEEKINQILRRNPFVILCISMIIIAVTYVLSKRFDDNYLLSNFLLKNCGTIALLLCVIIFLDTFKIFCNLTLKFGSISMEIFLFHIILLNPVMKLTDDNVIYTLIVVICTIMFSIPLSIIDKKATALFSK